MSTHRRFFSSNPLSGGVKKRKAAGLTARRFSIKLLYQSVLMRNYQLRIVGAFFGIVIPVIRVNAACLNQERDRIIAGGFSGNLAGNVELYPVANGRDGTGIES